MNSSPWRSTRIAAPCLASLLASCYSTATLHTARPIEPDEVQTAVALGAFVGEDDGDVSALPTVEGQLRRGVSERLDVGLHLTNLGVLGLDANYAVILTETQAVSIDPSVEVGAGIYAWLPILWDFHRTENLTLTGSLRGGRFWPDYDADDADFLLDELQEDVWLYGPGLAAQIRVNDSISIAPEVRVLWLDRDVVSKSGPLISASLGIIF